MGTPFTPPEQVAAGFYLGKAEREELIKSSTPLLVVAVSQGTDTYQGRTRPVYKVTFEIDGEERGWDFGIGTKDGAETSRDRFFGALAEHLQADDPEPVSVIVGKVGSFYTVEAAS